MKVAEETKMTNKIDVFVIKIKTTVYEDCQQIIMMNLINLQQSYHGLALMVKPAFCLKEEKKNL